MNDTFLLSCRGTENNFDSFWKTLKNISPSVDCNSAIKRFLLNSSRMEHEDLSAEKRIFASLPSIIDFEWLLKQPDFHACHFHECTTQKETYLGVLRKEPLKVAANLGLKFTVLMRSDRAENVECFTYRRHFFTEP